MFTYSRFATEETLTESDLRALIANGKLEGSALLQRSDSSNWKAAAEYDELRAFFGKAPNAPRKATRPLRHFEPKFTPEEPAPNTSGMRLVGVWFAVVGSFAVFSMIPTLRLRMASEHWPAVMATATGWSIYEYEAGGQKHVGNHPDGYLHRGQQFVVHYDPNQPARSVTKIGLDGDEIPIILVFSLLGIGGMAMIVRPAALRRLMSIHVG